MVDELLVIIWEGTNNQQVNIAFRNGKQVAPFLSFRLQRTAK